VEHVFVLLEKLTENPFSNLDGPIEGDVSLKEIRLTKLQEHKICGEMII